jgi:hypothetical protein
VSKVLVVNDGKRERELLLVERLVVGRDPMCDLSHDDALLSRRHAEFQMVGDEVTVRDLGSRNGLFVNGNRAAERTLNPGDIVTIGPLRVRYLTTSATVSLAPDELDIDVTKVLPPPPRAAAAPRVAVSTPLPQPVEYGTSYADDDLTADEGEEDREGEEEEDEVTRVVHADEVESILAAVDPADNEAEATMMVTADEIGSGVRATPSASPSSISSLSAAAYRPQASAEGSAATLRVPPPGPLTPLLPQVAPTVVLPPPTPGVARRAAPAPAPAAAVALSPPAAAAPSTATAGLGTFVVIQLAALASVVFVASAAPLIMWHVNGTPVDDGSLGNLLRWPGLPIVIAIATTYVVATLLKRRFTQVLMAVQDELLVSGTDSGTAGDYRS